MSSLAGFIAKRIQTAGDALHTAFAKMPEERAAWKPTVEGNAGRDALDQVLECAYLGAWAAEGYAKGALPAVDWDDYKVQCDAKRNQADALVWLKSSNDALAAAITALSDEKLGESVTDPLHNTPSTWGDFAVDLVYWNLVYHEGQVNYLQVLYGDMS